MNKMEYTMLNADIPVMYIMVSVHIRVMFVIRHSVERAVLRDINACIVVSSLMCVMCVLRHSVNRAV